MNEIKQMPWWVLIWATSGILLIMSMITITCFGTMGIIDILDPRFNKFLGAFTFWQFIVLPVLLLVISIFKTTK